MFGLVRLSLKRLVRGAWLHLSLLLGLTISVGVVASVPIFARGVDLVLLRSELAAQAQVARRPEFALRFIHVTDWDVASTSDQYERLDQYLSGRAASEIGLPVVAEVRYVESSDLKMVPARPDRYPSSQGASATIRLAYISDLVSHADLVAGSYPPPVESNAPEVPVLVGEDLADKVGINAGEKYLLLTTAPLADGRQTSIQIPVRVSGIWRPKNPSDTYWFGAPNSLFSTVLVPEQTYRQRVAPLFKSGYPFSSWAITFDAPSIRPDQVGGLPPRIARMLYRANALWDGVSLDSSPQDQVTGYLQRLGPLTTLLGMFSVPILGLVLYFVHLITGLMIEERRGEIALLASRGASAAQLLLIQAIEAVAIVVVALPPGLLLAVGLARAMGFTLSFLHFILRSPLPVSIGPSTILYALLGAGVGMINQMVPSIRATRQPIVHYQRERSRSSRPPLWQRFYLDVVLLGMSVYGYAMLAWHGSLATFHLSYDGAVSPLQEPLVFVTPSLFVLALALVAVRLFPLGMMPFAWLSGAIHEASYHLVFRYLARSPHRATGMLLMIVLTLSLAVFTSSIAKTLDQSTLDRARYQVGADLTVYEKPSDRSLGLQGSSPSTLSPAQLEQLTVQLGGYLMPISEQAKIPGVAAAARVGEYPVKITLNNGYVDARLLGVDRVDFPKVAFFRRDFATQPLGGMMNDLAPRDSAVIVPQELARTLGLTVGDDVAVQMTVFSGPRTILLTVVDTYRYFPTAYPSQEPTLIANLDYIFQSTGEISPYHVWFATNSQTRVDAILDHLSAMGIPISDFQDANYLIQREQSGPERTGLFGMLSVGFLASAGLTAVGFLVHALASFRHRSIEFGVLRAIGLSRRQVITVLVLEQAIIITWGTLAGLALGTAASALFVPFFRIGVTPESLIPPFQVIIDWSDIARIIVAFVAILGVATVGSFWRLAQLQVFEAVKLGETQ